MKNKIQILFLILILTSCNAQNRIAKKNDIYQTPINQSQYDVIPISDIKEIFKIVINLPELQYLHLKQFPERLPLKILEFGDINANSLKGITKFGKPIKVVTKAEIVSNQIKDYLGVGDWSPVNGTLRLQLYYPIEGITINCMFKKEDKKWSLTDSMIIEK